MSEEISPEEAAQFKDKIARLREILGLIERGAESGISPPLDMHPDYARLKREYEELLRRLKH
jgi:hypothetical protein